MASHQIEPPDMGILRDRSQLEFYIDAVERWAGIATHTGTPEEIQAELVLTFAFKQYPELCKEMSDHFGNSLRNKKDGIKELVKWLKTKFGLNKHADMVKIINTFLNTCRNKTENLIEFITRFEKNYAEVKKMGEQFSPTCLSIFLLRQAQLTDTDSQIITINLEFDPKAPNAKENFENTKAAIKKFQHTKQANYQSNSGHSHQHDKPAGTYLTLGEEEGLDEEQLDSVKTFISSMRRGGGGGGGSRGGFPRRGGAGGKQTVRVWKCDYCICSHQKWKDCGCPCVNHSRENCPNPVPALKEAFRKRKAEQKENEANKKKTSETASTSNQADRGYMCYARDFTQRLAENESQYENTLLAKVVGETESVKFQPLTALIKALAMPGEVVREEYFHVDNPTVNVMEQVYLRNNTGEKWQDAVPLSKELHKLYMLLDCGSPSTIVGVENFRVIKSQYPEMIQSTFEYQESNKLYEFGGGERTFSMGRVRLPMYVLDKDQQAHLLHVWVEILNQQQLPLLFGGRSLIRSKGTLCFKSLTLQIDWKKERLCFPIKEADTGHFHLQFFPMSEQENSFLTREIVDRADWSETEVENIITYLATEDNPQVSRIIAPETISKPKQRKPLTKQQINRLHQALGHAHRDKIKEMVKNAKMFNENTLKHIDDLAQCEVCAVEHNRVPRPRVALPRSANFNHVVAIDLKENRRYKNAPPYILYFVDTFTRFKAAVFIKNKQAGTIAEHLVTEWIKYHGAPKYLMSDRGNEFVNGEVRELCQFHGIRFTSTASYSPHQNAYVERGHAVADRALERMMTADPKLKPEVALGWVIQAVNTLQNVNGFVPFQLVFGRLPKHPSLVEAHPGDNQEIADSQATWARHYRMMMAAREAFTASEADKTVRKALEQRVYTDPSKIKVGDWIYFKRNHERYWRGPAKLVMRDRKNLHCIFHGQPVVVNSDDVLLNKPETEKFTVEQFISLPDQFQPPGESCPEMESEGQHQTIQAGAESQAGSVEGEDQSQTEQQGTAVQTSQTDQTHNQPSGQGEVGYPQADQSDSLVDTNPVPSIRSDPTHTDTIQAETPSSHTAAKNSSSPHSPATSTISAIDLGTPLQCNLCDKETSSRNFQNHCQQTHNIQRPSVRQHATAVSAKPDSIYENFNNLKKGVVVVDDAGNYMTLINPTTTGWTTENISTKEKRNLELVKDMVDMRYIGVLEEETSEGIHVVNNNEKVFVQYGDYVKKVFFTAAANYHEEHIFVMNIPRSRHGEPECIAAKKKELRDFDNYDVYEVVDRPDNKNIISTEWVLVEKQKPDGSMVTKARLCIRGDQELGKHNIPVDSPTVNKISVKILLTLAISQGWNIRTADVERAFLQTEDIEREVFVRPPVELNLPRNKVLKLQRTAYGLVDASRSFFLKQAKEFKNIGFHPLSMDPAMFIHRPGRDQTEMCDAAAAVHVDDALNVGKSDVLDKAQQQMMKRLTYGSVETLPFRFLGNNYRQEKNGDIVIVQKHYADSLEVPNLVEMNNMAKQDVLPEHLQSTFRSLASKLNVLAAAVRPDFTYAAKYLTTRYNKATKSDMTQVVKLIRKAKDETTEIVIPNIGQPEEWILVGVVDASHRTSGNLFAVGGHVVMLLNKVNQAAAVLHWSSKKIERVVHRSGNNCDAEDVFNNLFDQKDPVRSVWSEDKRFAY